MHYLRMKAYTLLVLLLCLSTKGVSMTDSITPVDSTLNIGYHLTPPFVSADDNGLTGPGVWLWNNVNANVNLKGTPQLYSFEEILTALDSGKIDVCISPLSITSQRLEKFDFSIPYYTTNTSLLTRSVSGWQKGWRFFTSFFSLNFFKALGALAMVILIFGFAVWIFERRKNKEEFGDGIQGLWNGFWWSAVTMTTVGYGDKSPKTFGGRIIALFWMFTAIIIISGFTAGITSSLTTNEIGTQIDSTSDLKKQRVATIKNSGTAKWFEDNFFSNVKLYNSLEEALSALDKEEIDYIAYDQPILQHIINIDTEEKYERLDFTFNSQFYAVAFRKNFPVDLKKKISLQITKATETLEWKLLLNEYNLIKE